jgi:hypothetical protein
MSAEMLDSARESGFFESANPDARDIEVQRIVPSKALSDSACVNRILIYPRRPRKH